MLPLAKAAAAVACVLSAATGFLVPSVGPRPAAWATSNRFGQPHPRPPSLRCNKPLMMAATPVVKRVAIVGAGVGGLTLANALCTGSMAVEEVKVFEKFDSVKPGIGGGVQINSGAVILARLGLGDAIKVGRPRVCRRPVHLQGMYRTKKQIFPRRRQRRIHTIA